MKKFLVLFFLVLGFSAFAESEEIVFPKNVHYEVKSDLLKKDVPFKLKMNISKVKKILGKPKEIKELDTYYINEEDKQIEYVYEGISFLVRKGSNKVNCIKVTSDEYAIADGSFRIGDKLKKLFSVYGARNLDIRNTIYNGKYAVEYVFSTNNSKALELDSYPMERYYAGFVLDTESNACVTYYLCVNVGI